MVKYTVLLQSKNLNLRGFQKINDPPVTTAFTASVKWDHAVFVPVVSHIEGSINLVLIR